MKKPISIIFILLAILTGCSMAPDQAGTSEQGNARMTATVYRSDGLSAAFATVRIHRADYVKGIVLNKQLQGEDNLKTDSLGSFTIDSLDTGSYSIEVTDNSKEAVLLKCKLTNGRDGVIALTGTLQPFAALKGKVDYNPALDRRFVQVEGLERLVEVDTNGNYCLPDLPYGAYNLRIVSVNPSIEPAVISGVVVREGSVTLAPYNGWIFSRTVFLNTTSSGAGISGNVCNFPVLIRLTTGNFKFNEAKANGEDFRVYKSETDSTALPFEIERWDSSAGAAEIWVKVDTVYGNSIKSSFIMKWGNPSVQTGNSNGAAVFDTAGGFEGVWHLNETSGTQAADASHNGFAGTYMGGLPRNVNGPFGICQNIAHSFSDYIDIGNVLNPGMKNISIGVWAKKDSSGTLTLISKTNGDAPSAAFGYVLTITDKNYPTFYMASGGTLWGDDGAFDISSDQAITDTTTWHYLFVVIDRSDNSGCKMYVDGIDRTGIVQGNVTKVVNFDNDLNLRIGIENDNDCPFKGMIGEATIAFTTRSADWVKLSYMNQREQDALVKW